MWILSISGYIYIYRVESRGSSLIHTNIHILSPPDMSIHLGRHFIESECSIDLFMKLRLSFLHLQVTTMMHPSIHPSIHPFSSTYPRLRHGGSRLSRVLKMSVTPATVSSSSWGIQRHSQSRWKVIPPVSSGSAQESHPNWTCLENLHRGGILIKCLQHSAGSFVCEGATAVAERQKRNRSEVFSQEVFPTSSSIPHAATSVWAPAGVSFLIEAPNSFRFPWWFTSCRDWSMKVRTGVFYKKL